MNYTALHIAFSEQEQAEILTAWLSDYPFESFETEGDVLRAYIQDEQLDACRMELDALLTRLGVEGSYECIGARNWNAVWESDFPVVDVEGRLLIRAPFHEQTPYAGMVVVVNPHMSFGTGHHATTWLMSRATLDLGVAGRRGLDLGSGTGVLAIVAARCGAEHVDAVDIDDWADESCRENVTLNDVVDRITPILGDMRSVEGRRYDFILANINRNILTAGMATYAAALEPGGDLLMSGFLEADACVVAAAAQAQGLSVCDTQMRDGWVVLHCRKQSRS